MGIDLVHDEAEKELLTVNVGWGDASIMTSLFAALAASVCLSEEIRVTVLSIVICK